MTRRRAGSVVGFLGGVLLALTAFVSPALIFAGLILFIVGWGIWPIGLSIAGAFGLGIVVSVMSNMREETRWVRMTGSSGDRCAYCRTPIGPAAFIRAPAPLKGVIHSACYSKAFVKQPA